MFFSVKIPSTLVPYSQSSLTWPFLAAEGGRRGRASRGASVRRNLHSAQPVGCARYVGTAATCRALTPRGEPVHGIGPVDEEGSDGQAGEAVGAGDIGEAGGRGTEEQRVGVAQAVAARVGAEKALGFMPGPADARRARAGQGRLAHLHLKPSVLITMAPDSETAPMLNWVSQPQLQPARVSVGVSEPAMSMTL